MTRVEATTLLRTELNKHGLTDWTVRLNNNPKSHFLGLCSYKDKCIILSSHHIDIHPTPDVANTIRHEVAHALMGPGHGHDALWADKAREIGCDNTLPCSTLSLSPDIIDAIRSGADVEVTFEEQIIRTPRYNITRLQDRCDECGVVAKTAYEELHECDDFHPDIKIIELECGHWVVRSIPKGTPFHTFQFGGREDCKHEWDKNTCILCDRKRPYQFQIEGMAFGEAALSVNNGVAIFDEMGLGKTIQAEGIIYFHPELCTPTLWIVKSGLKYPTAVSNVNWMGDDHVTQIIETSKDWLIPKMKHYVISYDMLVQKTKTNKKTGKVSTSGFDIKQFDRVGIKCVVLDECQQIKNVDSARTQMVRQVVKGRKVIALSGTPWNNRGSELFPILNMMDPMKFYSEAHFKRVWVDTYYDGKYIKEGGIRNVKRFKEFTKDLIIRRERTEVLPELPLVNRTKLYVKMDPQSEENYDEAVQEFVEWYEEQVGNISSMMIIAAMQKMRHLVGLAKIPAIEEYVSEFVEETDRKLVIFAHHKDVQAILYDEIKTAHGHEVPVLRYISEMNAKDRWDVAAKFNDSKRAILICSTIAGGEGLNLQTCCDCIVHERMWNPGREEQAESRFIRIGAVARQVNALYAHCEGLTTIDPNMDNRNERKRAQFHAVHNNTEMPAWSEDAMWRELAEDIVNNHNAKKGRKGKKYA